MASITSGEAATQRRTVRPLAPRRRPERLWWPPVTASITGGKKELTGKTDIEIEISNPCARLIATTLIYYNSAILSRLLAKHEASGNAKVLAMIKKISPAAWRHVHLNGHYTFRSVGPIIDLDRIVAGLDLS